MHALASVQLRTSFEFHGRERLRQGSRHAARLLGNLRSRSLTRNTPKEEIA